MKFSILRLEFLPEGPSHVGGTLASPVARKDASSDARILTPLQLESIVGSQVSKLCNWALGNGTTESFLAELPRVPWTLFLSVQCYHRRDLCSVPDSNQGQDSILPLSLVATEHAILPLSIA